MKHCYLILFIILISSCKTSQNLDHFKCNNSKYSKNEFKNVTNDEYETVINNDTISINQIKYNCVFTGFLLKKVMYDNFGKWDESRYKKDERHPILVWKNVQLFSSQPEKYMIATTGGGEEENKIFASIMIFDKNGKDLLAENLNLRNKITEYFTQLIKSNNMDHKEFYPIYWKEVDPAFYERIYK